MMIIYINTLDDDDDDDGNEIPYDDASSDDDEDDGDSCHSSHKSVEQCEWAAGFYHLHTYIASTSTSTYLPYQCQYRCSPTSYSTSNTLCQYQCNEFQYSIHGFAVVCWYHSVSGTKSLKAVQHMALKLYPVQTPWHAVPIQHASRQCNELVCFASYSTIQAYCIYSSVQWCKVQS